MIVGKSKAALKDAFYRYVPTHLSRHILPHLPGNSPYDPCMLETGVIFIHVPKAAGTSLKKDLYKTNKKLGHRRIGEFFSYDPTLAVQLHKFAIVRNPWDRFLSAYTFLRQGIKTSRRDKVFVEQVLGKFPDFTEFVKSLEDYAIRRRVLSYDHFRPQSYWICRPGAKTHAIDQLGHFETLNEDVAMLYETIGRDHGQLPHARASTHLEYRDEYTDKTRQIIADLYAADLDLLRYTF